MFILRCKIKLEQLRISNSGEEEGLVNFNNRRAEMGLKTLKNKISASPKLKPVTFRIRNFVTNALKIVTVKDGKIRADGL